MSKPLVSVVIPVYNSEKYLQLAIDSILSQTYTNLELILMNDVSTDSSKEICLSNKDPRVLYFENEKNLGIALTRNAGFSKAKGKYIAILDNDDISLPERLERQVEFLENHPDYGMCGTFYSVIDGEGKQVFKVELPTNLDSESIKGLEHPTLIFDFPTEISIQVLTNNSEVPKTNNEEFLSS